MTPKQIFVSVVLAIMATYSMPANEALAQEIQLDNIYSTGFENGTDDWNFIDEGWKIVELTTVKEKKTAASINEEPVKTAKQNAEAISGNSVLSQHTKESQYKPPFRSPLHMALLKKKIVTDFQLDIRVHSTHKDYPHRDACLFFGYQNPSQFYYVHFGKKGDDYANQIFIVNKAARKKISLTTTEGTPWDENWHNVRIKRDATHGEIQVYFDDMETPAMTANDKTFTWGQVGIGSFDDTADWDDMKLKGKLTDGNSTADKNQEK